MGVQFAGNILVQANGGPLPISQGGTGQTTAPAAINALLPVQTGNSGKVLTTNGTNVSWSNSGGVVAGGSDTQIQFNDSGALNGLSSLVINKSTGALTGTSIFTNAGTNITGNTSTFRSLKFQTAGSDRWIMQANNATESGSSAGSNFEFVRVADNGATSNQVFTVARNTGVVDFKVAPTVNGASIGGSLTSTQIGVGDGSNLLSGSAAFTFSTSTNTLIVGTSNALPTTIQTPDLSTGTNAAGNLTVKAGNGGSGTVNAGNLFLRGGNYTSTANAQPGSVTLQGGDYTGAGAAVGGNTIINGGLSNIAAGGYIVMQTSPSGGAALVERMRIAASGSITTSTGSSVDFGSRYTELSNAITATASTNIDCSLGNIYNITMSANITTLSFSNVPSSGRVYNATLILNQDVTGNRTVTWPASVKFPGGTAPTLSGPSKVDIVTLMTVNGGTTWYAFVGGLNF